MAMNAAANLVEKIVGHQTDTTITTNVSNPNVDIEKFADTSVPMKALAWQGKNHVEISPFPCISIPKSPIHLHHPK
jgi:hypothetical protein